MAQAVDDSAVDATPLYSNPGELGKVLYALTQPNNSDLKRATLLIQDFLDKPDAIMPLVQQIETSQSAEVRQVAAVYLREQIEEFYKKVPSDVKPKLKNFLLTKLLAMDNRAERLAIGAAIASIAKYALTDEKEGWNELLVTLENVCKPDQNVELREVGYVLWRNLVSFCGGSLKKHFGKILGILQAGLKDEKSTKIQIESVRSIGVMVEFLENEKEVATIEELIPAMVGVIDKCLKKGDEDNVIAGMEVFNDLVESKVPVIHKHAEQLTKFNLKIAAAKDELPMTVRKQATNFATWMCKSKPKTVIKHNFIQPFLTLCINLVIESHANESVGMPDNADQEDDEDEKTAFLSPIGIACDLLDELFLNIPSPLCFPIAMDALEKLLVAPQANQRKAGYVLIAMMSEGCKEIMAKGDNLKLLVNACLKGMADESSTVRKCSLEAVSQICTHCNFDILQHHRLLLPNIIKIFDKADEEVNVQERALSAIEMFIDAYDPNDDEDTTPSADNGQFELVLYLQDIMTVIGKCLETESLELQKQAICTLSSCATAARQGFNVYLPKVIQLLESLMQIKEPAKIGLRAEATSCLGAVAGVVGYESFKSILPKFHQFVMDGLMDLDDSDIRESSFMYFSELAEIMGADVMKLDSFEEMLNFLLFVIEDDDGLMVELPDDGFRDAIPKALIDGEDKMAEMEALQQGQDFQTLSDEQVQKLLAEATAAEEEDEADEMGDEDNEELLQNAVGQLKSIKLNVTTGFMEEKAAAVHALTSLIKNGGFAFLTHLDECWERLSYLWEYPHSLVKIAVSACFHAFFTLIVNHQLDAHNEIASDAEGNKHFPRNGSIAYNENVQRLISTIFPLYIQALRDEDDRDALSVMMDYFISELKSLGVNSLAPCHNDLVSAIKAYLSEECQCQQSSDALNPDTKDIATKHRWVSDTVADLIATLAELMQSEFAPKVMALIWDKLAYFGRETRHPQDQAMVVGCIADCCSRLSDAGREVNVAQSMNRFAEPVFALALRNAATEDVNQRQNALYAVGAMSYCCDHDTFAKQCGPIMAMMQRYLAFPGNGTRQEQLVRDNAVSALGKMMISHPQQLPTDKLLPSFLQALPLTCDFSENVYVYEVVVMFIERHQALIQAHMGRALQLIGMAVEDKEVPQQPTDRMVSLLKKICGDTKIQQLVESLPDQAKANIKKAVS